MIKNKIHHGNFLANDLPDGCAKLIIADPPYFEVKGKFDFIWPSFDAYLLDVEKWVKECARLLADNGTLFWWGHAKKIAYSQVIIDKYLTLLNSLIWRKRECQTRASSVEDARSFIPVTERLLMYSKDQFNLTECVYHIRDYIRAEIVKSKGKIVLSNINKALGTATNGGGVASACLSLDKSEPTMITGEMYLKLQEWCGPFLRKEYEDLRKEYEDLRKEYEEQRRYFNNYRKIEDVMEYSQESNISRKYQHPTQKPEKLTKMLIDTTTRKGDLVIIPFAGSGTECAMAAKTGRPFIGYDIDEKHINTARKRCDIHLRQLTIF